MGPQMLAGLVVSCKVGFLICGSINFHTDEYLQRRVRVILLKFRSIFLFFFATSDR